MTRLKLMSLTAVVAFYIAPIAWLMGPTDGGSQTDSFGRATVASSPPRTATCEPGDRIDIAATDAAGEKTESKGFADLSKPGRACDKVWYASAPSEGRDGGN
jgi:hypothetical protein